LTQTFILRAKPTKNERRLELNVIKIMVKRLEKEEGQGVKRHLALFCVKKVKKQQKSL
jgi:hypothetical protein